MMMLLNENQSEPDTCWHLPNVNYYLGYGNECAFCATSKKMLNSKFHAMYSHAKIGVLILIAFLVTYSYFK